MIAILITILVLVLPVRQGSDLAALAPLVPFLLGIQRCVIGIDVRGIV